MQHKEVWDQLKLDSLDIVIAFDESKKRIMDLLNEKNISINVPGEEWIILYSKMFCLDMQFCIGFRFKGEKLVSISISPEKYVEGKEVYLRYKEIQSALEKELGRPNNYLCCMMKWWNSDRRAYWRGKEIFIEHYLRERFGMEENIHICRMYGRQ